MYSENNKKKPLLFRNLRKRYLLRIQDEISLHDRLFLKLSKAKVYFFGLLLAVMLIVLTTLLIAFTDLRKFIPGYSNTDMLPKIYAMELTIDSLESMCLMQNVYIANIRNILTENITAKDSTSIKKPLIAIDNIQYAPSYEDSLLRNEIEAIKSYTLHENIVSKTGSISNENLVLPVVGGVIITRFSRLTHHYGIDLSGKNGDLILSALDGSVIFTEWTIETGHVLVIQHKNDLISIYKNNSLLLKKTGDYVQAGDPIAVIGSAGEITELPHLHFELWYKGIPLNPEDYLML